MQNNFKIKIKDNIIQELNQDLYRHLNMDLFDADHFFGYYNGYIYKLINRVYEKHGAKGLRIEIKYIIEYLIFLMNKLTLWMLGHLLLKQSFQDLNFEAFQLQLQ